MQEITIKSNNHFRPIIYGYELTGKEKKEFDYYSEEELNSAQFFRYKGKVYGLDEFVICSSESLKEWDGVCSDSYFSGVLIKFSKCAEYVKVARFYC